MPSRAAKVAGLLVCAKSITPAEAAGPNWYPYDEAQWTNEVHNANYFCGNGMAQSPIDFPSCPSPMDRDEPTFTWGTMDATIHNNGHTVQLTVLTNQSTPGKMIYADIGGIEKAYTILQCHFHHTSEHTLAGTTRPMEVHCVHTYDNEGSEVARYGVLGVFYAEPGAVSNDFLTQFEDDIIWHPDSVGERRLEAADLNLFGEPMVDGRMLASDKVSVGSKSVNFTQLYGQGVNLKRYFNYEGSFTTPPCTEVVDFFIFMDEAPMSASQLQKFQNAMGWQNAGGNFRPPQDLHQRSIYGCTLLPPAVPNKPWYPYDGLTWASAVGASSAQVCLGGSSQSPIDFPECAQAAVQSALEITWESQTVSLENNGHTVVLFAKGSPAGQMIVPGTDRKYDLLQCHFHYGSEHQVGGRQYPFEAHCVHQQTPQEEAPHYGVFGVFYEIDDSTADVFLGEFEDELPARSRRLEASGLTVHSADLMGNALDADGHRMLAGRSVSSYTGPLDFKKLYSTNSLDRFWRYAGSLTTPPCVEAVDFHILMDPQMMTNAQLTKFKAAIGWSSQGGNFRRPQRLHSRTIEGCAILMNHAFVIDEAIEQTFTARVRGAVGTRVAAEMTKILDEEQASHSAVYTTCIIIIAFAIALVSALVGLTFVVYKKRTAKVGGSGDGGAAIGNGSA